MVVRTAERYTQTFSKLFIVLKEDDEAVSRLVEPLGPTIVIAHEAAQGMGRSLAAGIAAAADHPFVFIALADMPFARASTLRQLLDLAAPGSIVRPLYRGTPGHPVGFAEEYFEALKQLGRRSGRARRHPPPFEVSRPALDRRCRRRAGRGPTPLAIAQSTRPVELAAAGLKETVVYGIGQVERARMLDDHDFVSRLQRIVDL